MIKCVHMCVYMFVCKCMHVEIKTDAGCLSLSFETDSCEHRSSRLAGLAGQQAPGTSLSLLLPHTVRATCRLVWPHTASMQLCVRDLGSGPDVCGVGTPLLGPLYQNPLSQ